MKKSILALVVSLGVSTLTAAAEVNNLHFGKKSMWLTDFGYDQTWRSYNKNPRQIADVNGDNKADIVGFGSQGTYVALSNGAGFDTKKLWLEDFGIEQTWHNFDKNPRLLADVNGDNKADIVGFGSQGVHVSLSNGSGFEPQQLWLQDFGINQTWSSFDQNPRLLADVNGDNKADIVGFASDGVYVSLSTGTGFAAKNLWIQDFAISQTWNSYNQNPRLLGDVNGDNKADIVGFASDGVYVALSNGVQFQSKSLWLQDFAIAQTWYTQSVNPRMLGRLDRCNGLDLIGFSSGGTEVSLTQGKSFAPRTNDIRDFGYNQTWFSFDLNPRFSADVNGDGLDDIIGFGSEGAWVSLAK